MATMMVVVPPMVMMPAPVMMVVPVVVVAPMVMMPMPAPMAVVLSFRDEFISGESGHRAGRNRGGSWTTREQQPSNDQGRHPDQGVSFHGGLTSLAMPTLPVRPNRCRSVAIRSQEL